MKTVLFSTALAVGFSGAAAAQTSVTLYGVIDGGFGYTQFKSKTPVAGFGDKASRIGLHDANQQDSAWGLIGTEDLGGGLKAIFQLESGYSMANGHFVQNGRLFGLEASLGLASDAWGTLKFGRQLNFASNYFVGFPQADAFGEGHSGATFTSAATVRYDNLITYETPSFAGFQLGVGYAFEADGSQPWDISGMPDTDQTAITTGLRYANGALALAATYDILNKRDNVPGEGDVKSWTVSASYDFDVATLHLGFGQDKDGVLAGRGLPDDVFTGFGAVAAGQDFGYIPLGYKTSNYSAGVAIPLSSNSQLDVGWHSARLGSSLYKSGILAAGGKSSQNLYTVIYNYDLSRRTNLYVFGTYGTGYAFNDINVTQAVVGLRHRF